MAHALVTNAFVGSGCSTLPVVVTVPASAGWQRLAWVARRRWAVQVMGWLFPYSPMLF